MFFAKPDNSRCKQKTYAARRVLQWLKSASNQTSHRVFYRV
jgi:hypothetical protein